MSMAQGDSDPRKGREIEWDDQPAAESPLERAIAETLASSDEPLAAADLEALRDVARRYPGHGPELDPVGIDLVTAFLNSRWAARRPFVEPARWQEMCREVAETLWGDPPARRRVEELWQQLRESVK